MAAVNVVAADVVEVVRMQTAVVNVAEVAPEANISSYIGGKCCGSECGSEGCSW